MPMFCAISPILSHFRNAITFNYTYHKKCTALVECLNGAVTVTKCYTDDRLLRLWFQLCFTLV